MNPTDGYKIRTVPSCPQISQLALRGLQNVPGNALTFWRLFGCSVFTRTSKHVRKDPLKSTKQMCSESKKKKKKCSFFHFTRFYWSTDFCCCCLWSFVFKFFECDDANVIKLILLCLTWGILCYRIFDSNIQLFLCIPVWTLFFFCKVAYIILTINWSHVPSS